MTEDQERILVKKYKGFLRNWNVSYPLPEWVLVWFEYLQKIEEVQEKYKDYKLPERQFDGGLEQKELDALASIYYKKSQNLFFEYKRLHPEEFEDKK